LNGGELDSDVASGARREHGGYRTIGETRGRLLKTAAQADVAESERLVSQIEGRDRFSRGYSPQRLRRKGEKCRLKCYVAYYVVRGIPYIQIAVFVDSNTHRTGKKSESRIAAVAGIASGNSTGNREDLVRRRADLTNHIVSKIGDIDIVRCIDGDCLG